MNKIRLLCGTLTLSLSGCAILRGGHSDPTTERNPVVRIHAGNTDTCVVYRDNTAACWGRVRTDSVFPFLLRSAEPIAMVETGGFNTCGLSTSGKILCSRDILGIAWEDPAIADCRSHNCLHAAPTPPGQRFTIVTTGFLHACALDSDGRVWCFGMNHMGQLGNGQRAPSRGDGGPRVLVPTAVVGDLRFRSISTESEHACGLTLRGEAYCWGSGRNGELGIDSVATYCAGAPPYSTAPCTVDRPVRVNTSQRFKQISAGLNLTCAVSVADDAWCWGSNSRCELATCKPDHSAAPLRIPLPTKIAQIDVGHRFACAITVDYRAFCWGTNGSGQLSVEVIDSSRQCPNGGSCSPIPIEVTGNKRWLSLSAGENRVCGITVEHEVYCWGAHRHRDLPLDSLRERCVEEDNNWQNGRCLGLTRMRLGK